MWGILMPCNHSSHRSPPCSASAFTLIELIVTVTIIGLLAGLLLPVVGMVRSAAQASVCGNNLRQVAMAAQCYANDNDGLLAADHKLTSAPWREKEATTPAWFNRLPPYLDLADTGTQKNVFQCPVWRVPAKAANPLVANYPRSYKQNDHLDYDTVTKKHQLDQDTPTNRHYRLGSTPDQGELLLFADAFMGKDGTSGYGQQGHLQQGIVEAGRHRGRIEGVMIDGAIVSGHTAGAFTWWSRTWDPPP